MEGGDGMTQLYFIHAIGPGGEDLDQVVEASSPGEAVAVWADIWHPDLGWDWKLIAKLYRLPAPTGTPKALLWGSMDVTDVQSSAIN